MQSGRAGQTLRGHASRDRAPVPLRTSARALIDKSLPPCASVAGPLQRSAPRAAAPDLACPLRPLPLRPRAPVTPCRWPPPTMRTRVAPRARGSPSTATTRPAAASSPPITSGEGADRRVGRGWGLPGPRLRRHHGQRPRAGPHPGHAIEPAAPVCCAPGPTSAPPPKGGPGARDGGWRPWGMGQPPLFLGRPPVPGFLCVCGLQIPYLFPHKAG